MEMALKKDADLGIISKQIEFTNNPVITIKADPLEVLKGNYDFSSQKGELIYSDEGFTLFNGDKEAVILQTRATDFTYKTKTGGRKAYDLLIDINDIKVSRFTEDGNEEAFDGMNINYDLGYSGDEQRSLLRNLSLSQGDSILKISGDLTQQIGQLIPYGDLKIELENKENIIDLMCRGLEAGLRESDIGGNSLVPSYKYKDEHVSIISNFIDNIATNISEDTKRAEILITREKGQPLFVGDKNIGEVLFIVSGLYKNIKAKGYGDANETKSE